MAAPPRIFFFTPYDERGLGVAYNSHAALLPDDDAWGVFTDIDVMFFSNQLLGQQVAEVIVNNPTYQVFTCVTNRMCARCQQQIQDRAVREERDLVKLKRQADFQFSKYRGKVELIRGFFAGYFIVFQKKLWRKHPFPNVGSQGGRFLGVDTAWSRTLRESGVKVGLMWGLMATHFFRLDKGETDLTHLNDPTHDKNDLGPRGRIAWRGAALALGGRYIVPLVPDPKFQSKPVYIPMIKLNPDIRPPCGYKFRDADGIIHFADSTVKLVETIKKYRVRVGRPPGDPLAEFTMQVYGRFPQCCLKG